jgi:hypothetical protein
VLDPALSSGPNTTDFGACCASLGTLELFSSMRAYVLTRFRSLAEGIQAELPVRSTIVDGEVLAFNPAGQMGLRALMRGRGSLHYFAFHLLIVRISDTCPCGASSGALPSSSRRLRRCSPAC